MFLVSFILSIKWVSLCAYFLAFSFFLLLCLFPKRYQFYWRHTCQVSQFTAYSVTWFTLHPVPLSFFFLFLSFQSFVNHFEGVQRFEDVHVNCVHLIWSQFYGIFCHHARITQELGGKFVVKVTFTGHAVVMSVSCIPWQRLMLLCVKGTITLTWWLLFGRSLLSKTFLLCGHDI